MKGFFHGSDLAKKPPPARQPQCGQCKLYRGCQSPKIPVQGKGRAKVLFVGSGATKADDVAGRHMAGDAGQYLAGVWRTCTSQPLRRSAWLTNSTICGTDKRPDSAQVNACSPTWRAAVAEYKPQVIIPMGEQAVASVVSHLWGQAAGGVDKWAGQVIPDQTLNAWVCPTWEPGEVMGNKDPVTRKLWHDHLTAAAACQGVPWPDGPPDWKKEVKLYQQDAPMAAALDAITERGTGVVAWDYEGNCLKPEYHGAQLASVAVSWGRLWQPETTFAGLLGPQTRAALSRLLRSPVPKVAANMKFEDRWTRQAFGHGVRNWVWDTMLGAHVADNRTGVTGVKYQAYAMLGQPIYDDGVTVYLKSKPSTKLNRIRQQVSVRKLLTYNGMDALLEYRLAVHQIRALGLPLPWEK